MLHVTLMKLPDYRMLSLAPKRLSSQRVAQAAEEDRRQRIAGAGFAIE
jgi:hypothetical protein